MAAAPAAAVYAAGEVDAQRGTVSVSSRQQAEAWTLAAYNAAAAAEVAAEADNASTPSPGAPAATAAHGEEPNPAASSQGGEITGGAAAEVPSSNAEEESETVASEGSAESDVPEDPVEAAAEAEAILQDWPPESNIWIIGKDASDGSFDDLALDVFCRSCRLDHLAEAHGSVGLVIVKEIIPLLGGAGERRVTQGLDEDEHAKLCLLLDALPASLSDELRSVMPRPDELIRLTSDIGYNPDSPEVPVRLWYPFDKDFHGQLLAAIDPRPNGKKKKKKWLK